ncbi:MULTISPECIES: hypothetical protein [Rhodococcus]|uniref:Homeodomain-like domain-containing protein n=1 Tax=Nocardia globerula TaxID=1818 RepID=A0A652YHW9_NOCGL|nr:hypothetical protein [Rhodococcus globerulus]NMD64243.1 hypothetical protein [Nocardia globerula]
MNTDDEREAWDRQQDGASWDQIGIEMGCTPATARSFAAEYERRTDAQAAAQQTELF